MKITIVGWILIIAAVIAALIILAHRLILRLHSGSQTFASQLRATSRRIPGRALHPSKAFLVLRSSLH